MMWRTTSGVTFIMIAPLTIRECIVVGVAELMDTINGLSNRISPSLVDINAEHIMLADVQLVVILSFFVSSILLYG